MNDNTLSGYELGLGHTPSSAPEISQLGSILDQNRADNAALRTASVELAGENDSCVKDGRGVSSTNAWGFQCPMDDLKDVSSLASAELANERHTSASVPANMRNPSGKPRGEEETFASDLSEDDLTYTLHNARKPYYHLKHQKPEHLNMVFLKAQGLSHVEIAERTGYTTVGVSNVLRQDWAQQQLLIEIKRAGRDEVSELLRGSAVDSIRTLLEIRDNPEAKNADRRSCADSLLDRFLGKAPQVVHNTHKNLEDLSDAELENIVRTERTATHSVGNPIMATSTSDSV